MEMQRIERFAQNYPVICLGSLSYDDKEGNIHSTDIVENYIHHFDGEEGLYSFKYIDGDYYPCFFSIYDGNVWLAGPDHDEWDYGESVNPAIAYASQVKFDD